MFYSFPQCSQGDCVLILLQASHRQECVAFLTGVFDSFSEMVVDACGDNTVGIFLMVILGKAITINIPTKPKKKVNQKYVRPS